MDRQWWWCNINLKHFFSQSFFFIICVIYYLPQRKKVSTHLQTTTASNTGPNRCQRVTTGSNGSQRVTTGPNGLQRVPTGPNGFDGGGRKGQWPVYNLPNTSIIFRGFFFIRIILCQNEWMRTHKFCSFLRSSSCVVPTFFLYDGRLHRFWRRKTERKKFLYVSPLHHRPTTTERERRNFFLEKF